MNHTQLIKPLCYQSDLDGKTYLQDDVGNKYGIKDENNLRMCNGDNGRLIYSLQDVDNVSLKDEVCIVLLTDGSVFQHKKKINVDESINPYDLLDYTRTDLSNTINVIRHQFPNWMDCLYFDEMDGRIYINPLMYGGINAIKPYIGDGSDLLQILDALCQLTATINENNRIKTIHFKPNKETVEDAIKKLAWDNKRNSFIYRISSVKWDGISRIDTFLSDVGCKAELTNGYDEELYLRFVSRGIFLVALDRSLNTTIRSIPFMPIFIGEQGTGKSDLCKWLGMDWYRGTITEMGKEKMFYESSNGSVILELIEGSQFNNTSMEIMKAMVEKDRIQFRGSYEKYERTIPIRFLMIATTNNMKPLSDGSGNRRFYPIYKTRDVLLKQIEEYTDNEILQLWAEALNLYNSGVRWDDDLLDENMQRIFRTIQGDVTSLTPPFDELKDWLDFNYGNIGDRVSNRSVREFLESQGWYGKDAEKKLTTFTKHYAMGFGYRSLKPTSINGELSRGFERIR